MKRTISSVSCIVGAALLFFTLAPQSQAQIGIRIGGGGGGGFYPGGNNYGRSYYGNGYSNYGRGYGYGPGSLYGPSGVGIGIGVNSGYGVNRYGVNNGYYSQPNIIGGTTSTYQGYQSYYPPTDVGAPVNYTNSTPNDGRGRIVVNVPANAQVFWNGSQSTLTGSTRLYGTLPLSPDGSVQRFEARWTGSDGQPVAQTREVRAMPNATVTVDFTRPQADVRTPANN